MSGRVDWWESSLSASDFEDEISTLHIVCLKVGGRTLIVQSGYSLTHREGGS